MAAMTKERLKSYIHIKKKADNQEERLIRMRSDEQFPALRMGDGSKRNPGASDRMANAVIRRMTYEEKISASLDECYAEMGAIEDAIEALPDALEQEVLRMRYIDGNGKYGYMPWRDVAIDIYGDDDDQHLRAVHRLHGQALVHIRKGDR